MTFRIATAEDAEFIRALITEVVADELQVSMFPEALRAQLLDMQYRARLHGIRQNYPDAVQEIICDSDGAAGWFVVNRSTEEIRLVDIIVAKARRRSGAGTAALERLVRESEESGKRVRLIVRQDNPALRLYLKSGFQTIGADKLNLILERPPARPPEM